MTEFHFDDIGATRAVSTDQALAQAESIGARIYLARVAEEDGAALVGRVARIRRGLSQLAALCFDDLTEGLGRANPAAFSEARAELEALLVGAQRLGAAAHALDVAAQRAHWACYEYAPESQAREARMPDDDDATGDATTGDADEHAPDDYAPELEAGESSRDEDARDVEAAAAPALPTAPASARAAVAPAVKEQPKIPVTPEAVALRNQFWAVVNRQGLSSKTEDRAARLAAIGQRIGRDVLSINTLTRSEWQDVIAGVETW